MSFKLWIKLWRDYPKWLVTLMFSRSLISMKYNENLIPRELLDVWHGRSEEDLLSLLRTCDIAGVRHFLEYVDIDFRSMTFLYDVVLHRPDCDQSTALDFFAYYYANYTHGRDVIAQPDDLEARAIGV